MPLRHQGKNDRITINNLNVSYNDEGPDEAPVIIFIHGFPFNKSMWDGQIEVFRDIYRVIAYDVRGHGNTDAGEGDFTIELFVKDLLALMDELKIESAVLCGLSMGGYIALNAVINHPERFAALILSDTQCAADTPEAKENRMKTIQNIKDNGVEWYAEQSIKKLFASESFIAHTGEIEAVRKMIVRTSKQSLYNTLVALSVRKETCSLLADIKIPVLIMAGKEDQITPPALSHSMHEKIQDSDLTILEHAGHIANMENQSSFNQQLRLFLARSGITPHSLHTSVSD